MDLLAEIKALEQKARQLEPDTQERQKYWTAVQDYAEDFLGQIEEIPAYVESEKKGRELLDAEIGPARSLNELLALMGQALDKPGLNPASGGHLGYIPGGGLYPSALGDFLAAVFNRYAGVFYGSPGAVRMENQLLKWLAKSLNFPETAAGNLCSGGSIANQIAIGCARDAAQLKARDFERAVIYSSKQVHHCVHKSINMVGLREAQIRYIPMDERFRMRADILVQQIAKDRAEGLLPFMVICSAGTTDSGAIDPLEQIADCCAAENIWMHVDAAYGGFFYLVDELRPSFKGLERADSLAIDPHKGLFLPYGTGAVLVRDGQQLFESQHLEASYLQDAYLDTEEVSPADLSPELTKHFRGLRMWLPLQLFGLEPFVAALTEKRRLTQYFYQKIQELGFEVGPPPQLSVMLYRYCPKSGGQNSFNLALVKKVRQDGRVFLSSTTIEGQVYLRLAVLSFRTHLQTIDNCLQVLAEAKAALLASGEWSD